MINVKNFFLINFILITYILFSCMCGGVELNKLLIDYGAPLISGFFISHSKYMLLNAASECFLMIFASNKIMKESEKHGSAAAVSLDTAIQELLDTFL